MMMMIMMMMMMIRWFLKQKEEKWENTGGVNVLNGPEANVRWQSCTNEIKQIHFADDSCTLKD